MTEDHPLLRTILADQFRLLTFRLPSPAIATHWGAYLAYGLFVTWLAGIGRYWDNPRASLFQHAGLGSLVYVVCLSLLLWLVCLPLAPSRWRFRNVLLFVTLCSLPALLYAIPVERFMPMEGAQAANAWFLAVVAAWRVALLAFFLLRVARMRAMDAAIATLLPLALIVTALAMLNLEHVVFELMAGIAPEQVGPNDAAYGVVMLIAVFSVTTSPALLVVYGVLVYNARTRRALAQAPAPPP